MSLLQSSAAFVRQSTVLAAHGSEFGQLPGEGVESGAGYGSFNGYTLIGCEIPEEFTGLKVTVQNNLQFHTIQAIGRLVGQNQDAVPRKFMNSNIGSQDCLLLNEYPLVYCDAPETSVHLPAATVVTWTFVQRAKSDANSNTASVVATQFPRLSNGRPWSPIFYSVGISGLRSAAGCNIFPSAALFGCWSSKVLNAQTVLYTTGSSAAQVAYTIAHTTNSKVSQSMSIDSEESSAWHAMLCSHVNSQAAFPSAPQLALYGFQMQAECKSDDIVGTECEPCSDLLSGSANDTSTSDLYIVMGVIQATRPPTKGASLLIAQPGKPNYLENPNGFSTVPVPNQ